MIRPTGVPPYCGDMWRVNHDDRTMHRPPHSHFWPSVQSHACHNVMLTHKGKVHIYMEVHFLLSVKRKFGPWDLSVSHWPFVSICSSMRLLLSKRII